MRLVMCLVISMSVCGIVHAQSSDGTNLEQARRRMSGKQLMFCFQGKGSCLPFDMGVMRAVYEQVPAVRKNQVIVAGNSGGSILAAYFANYGFSDATIDYAEYRLQSGGIDSIRKMERGGSKILKMARGEPTELPHIEMKEFVAFALGVSDWQTARSIEEIVAKSTAKPRFPVVIVAGNREVLDNRVPGTLFSSRNYKVFDPKNFSVSWKPEVHAYYQAHPDEFASDHPDLKLGPTPYIGKACTFFVDPSTYQLLKLVPASERIADLRLMETPADLAMAILASVSEPTYFDPIEDKEPAKLLTDARLGDLGNVKRRVYCGGFLISQPAQDIKRMLPSIRVAGSGWTHNPTMVRKILATWYLTDTEDVSHLTDWWADIQFNPTHEIRAAMIAKNLPSKEEFAVGKRTAERALGRDRALPIFVNMPHYYYPAADAIVPEGDTAHFLGPVDEFGKRPIRVARGLGELLPTGKTNPTATVALLSDLFE